LKYTNNGDVALLSVKF